MGTHGEREMDQRERRRERERELDLNLTMKESDVPNGFKEYRRCVSLPEKEREVISPCQDIFFVFFYVEMHGSSFTYMI